MWLSRLFNPMYALDIPYYLRFQRSRNKRFMRVVRNIHKEVLKIHPEYKVSAYDQYVLASFAKRFIGEWAAEVARINEDKIKKSETKELK